VAEIRKTVALPPREWDFSAMGFFTERDEPNIKKLAGGLSDTEIIEFYGLENTDSLSEYEQRFLKITIMKGRSAAKLIATEKLFKVMGSTSPKAADACLAFLTANAEKWKEVEFADGNAKTVTIKIDDGE